jgi:spermidine/putrescine transport system substrate-binding protein
MNRFPIGNYGGRGAWIARSLIVVFYLFLFAFFLYGPKLFESFFLGEKSINVYMFMDVLDQDILNDFERETGVNVNVSYYDQNEELLAKFRISGGEGYDLVMPSDFMVEFLLQYNLLQKIDKSKLKNYSKIDKRLLGYFFDPKNDYSLPYAWTVYGIGYNKKYVKNIDTWTPAFEQDLDVINRFGDEYKVCMMDEAVEAVEVAAMYLFGRPIGLFQEEIEQAKQALIKQRSFVEVYTHSSLKYFLYSEIVPMVVCYASTMKMAMMEDDRFGFIVPKEGSLLALENLAIPAASKNVDLAHKLIDFILSKKSAVASYDNYGFNPSNMEAYSLLDPKYAKNVNLLPDDKTFTRVHCYRSQLTPEKQEEMWLSIKTS